MNYDVIVVGGGPAGLSAAITAARIGVSTALLERGSMLGGMLTQGQIQPILGSAPSSSFCQEIIRDLFTRHPDFQVPVTRNGIEYPVDPEEARILLDSKCAEAGVDVFLWTPVTDVIQDGEQITGVMIGSPYGPERLNAKVVIDATGDGFVAFRAGAGFELGRESDGKCQPMSVEFCIDNLDETRAISCFGGSDPVVLSDGTPYAELCRKASLNGELPENVTIVRLHRTLYPGERNVNATQVNGLSPFSHKNLFEAEIQLHRQIPVIVDFLRKHVPGYENCRIKSVAPAIGVRETRRIIGLSRVTDKDVENGRKRLDAVVHNACFLIDIHNPDGGGQAEGHSRQAKPYDIPYWALVPAGVDSLLTAGRCISGTHRAHASYRVMAICMATGQAAGTAAALCAMKGIQPRELPAEAVRDALRKQGCNLSDE